MSDDFSKLMRALLDESLDVPGRDELANLLRDDSEARDDFIDVMMTEALLRRELAAQQVMQNALPITTSTAKPRADRRVFGVLALAALMVMAASVWVLLRSPAETSPLPHSAPPIMRPSPIALLSDISEGAVFMDSSSPMNLGSNLSTGPIKLVSGTVRIMFNSTAAMDLVGPCEVELLDHNSAMLRRGLLYADVPGPATGFTIHTPSGLSVVDVSTRFSVEITESGTQVDAQEGVVQLTRQGELLGMLTTGQAVMYRNGELTSLEHARGPLARRIHFGFAPGDAMGWQLHRAGQAVGADDDTRAEGLWAIDGKVTYADGERPMPPAEGEGLIGSMPFELRDEHHPTLVMRSPAFMLEPGGSIELKLLGGTGGEGLPPQRDTMLPPESRADGFMGVALRRVSDGQYLAVLRRQEPGEGQDGWQTLRFDPDILAQAADRGEVLTLDLIDAYEGPWGWIALDEVTLDGQRIQGSTP